MGILTEKQETFAQAIVAGDNQADAYKAAYSYKDKKHETIYSAASRLMANVKVIARIKELRAPVVEELQITLKDHLTELAVIRDQGKAEGKLSAAAQAEIARGKACGFYVEKIDATVDQSLTVELVHFGD